jgi:hypothetical protein
MRSVHLVGSVPLADRDAVFAAVGEILGERLKRYTDGETGGRKDWIQWQRRLLVDNPQFAIDDRDTSRPWPYYRLAPGVNPAAITFGPLGYAEHARSSYPEFLRLREAGVLPASARFLVTMPTSLTFLHVFISPSDRAAVAPAWERRVFAETAEIVAAIPHRDLAIQWDTVIEVLILEGFRQSFIDDSPAALVERLRVAGDSVPAGAELGYHFCYGDNNHKHSVEPRDTSVMVDLANALTVALHRPIDFIHMPVPRNRVDDAYFAPLERLAIAPSTELYLGLVHITDGEAGTRRRIAAAGKVRADFGIGTECGFGRRPPETIVPLLELHKKVASL